MPAKKLTQNKILKILLVIASVIFFIMLLIFIGLYHDNDYSINYKADSLYYYAEAGEYDRLYEMCCENRAHNVKADADMLEIYALADYYHNSFLYYACKDSDSTRAAQYLENMELNAANTGELSFMLEDIDAIFAD